MALALLASQNESYFVEQKIYTRKNPSSSTNPKLCPNPIFNRHIAGDSGHDSERRPHHEFGSTDLVELSPSAAAASDDSSSFDRNPADIGHRRDPGGGCVTFNVSSCSRMERRELKRRLEAELEHVRSVSSRIQSRFAVNSTFSDAALPAILGSDALIGRAAPPKLQTDEIKKRPAAVTMVAASPELRKLHTGIMKKCGQMLTKLMRHKGGSWFNLPVDAKGMGLHDYHMVVKNPMDLGTVKSKLGKGFYTGPFEFASDVRLTFNNALTYNPKGHFVHNFADQLLKQFETCFLAAYGKYDKDRSGIERREEEQRQRAASWARVALAPDPAPMISVPPVQSELLPVQSQPPPPKPEASEPNQRAMSLEEKERLGNGIQSLPDAKMAQVLRILSNRRNVSWMNGDEVEIDFEAMDNETLWELDRFVVDWNKTMMSRMKKSWPETTPTLSLTFDAGKRVLTSLVGGVLDFSLNNKKAYPTLLTDNHHIDIDTLMCFSYQSPESLAAKKIFGKKGDPVPVDEDVDIGDEMPVTHYPSVEIGKESSSSSSSGSDSSLSSRDSDSRSSSGSDSDDVARSPASGDRPEANTIRCS